jgi:uncharacterized membrane protein
MSMMITIVWAIFFGLSLLENVGNFKLPKLFTWGTSVLFVGNFMVILWTYLFYSSSYAQPADYINGVQGRYFIPYLVSLAVPGMLLSNRMRIQKTEVLFVILFVLSILTTPVVLLAMNKILF